MKGWSTFRVLRTGVLLVVLLVVIGWALTTQRRRAARTDWSRTLEVAVVVLDMEGGAADEDAHIEELIARLPDLAGAAEEELERVRDGAPAPFVFQAFGPVTVDHAPPFRPASDGLVDRVEHKLALDEYFDPLHERIGFHPRSYDVVLTMIVEPPSGGERSRRFVEGVGDLGGEFGLVRVSLDAQMVDQALIALLHELLHCLGATDKYDAEGHAVEPDGLAEPDLSPRYPQRYAEVMVGEVPLGPRSGRMAASIDEVMIGAATAREIGWLQR